jgi:hypothetical protein
MMVVVTKYCLGEQSRKMAQMLDRRCEYRIWWENLRERDYLEHLGIDGRLILK